jgi:type IV pilus assembly protein PilB
MVMQKKSLGEVLVEKNVISPEQLRQARDVQKSAPGDLGVIIHDLGFASEREIAAARAQVLGLQFVDLSRTPVEQEAAKSVPEHIVKRYNILPIKRDNTTTPNKLMVAVGDIQNSMAGLDDVRLVSRCNITPVLAAKSDIDDAIARNYNGVGAAPPPGPALPQAPIRSNSNGLSAKPVPIKPRANGIANPPAIIKDEPEILSTGMPAIPDAEANALAQAIKVDLTAMQLEAADDEDELDVERMSEEAPIIRIAHAIVQEAIRQKASDIHVEPMNKGVRIRYRVDGVLNETMTVPKHIQNQLIARFKIMADMNIAERRIPQDGRIPIKHDGKDFDLRVSCCPTFFGEKIVMRILDKTSVLLGLNKLGFSPDVQSKLEELSTQPNGMILTTGPTGSGKTTTLYSLLHKINSTEKNIITVEDPVEYQLGGVNQVAVNRKAGLTFGSALRSFLRQDPDIIMVGEMRDLETCQIAVEASLTGHLVLSTLHTNDSPSAIMRLADMGIESYLIAATVIAILAQRLCRKICVNCKQPYQIPASELVRFGFKPTDANQMVTLYRGAGCEECRNNGYKARLGLYDLLVLNEELRELIVRRAPVADIRDAGKAAGMKELREDGLLKVLEGVTTPDEVMRVVFTAGF